MIDFSCSTCRKHFRVSDALAGKSSKCKQCGASMRVPTESDPESAEKAFPVIDITPRPSRSAHPSAPISTAPPRRSAPSAVTATPLSAGSPDPAGLDGAVPALLLTLIQEYAMHHGSITEIQRKRREFHIPALLFGGGGGLVFAVCAIVMVMDLAGLCATRPPVNWAVGMFFGGPIALMMGFVWCVMLLEERQKIAAGEAGKADVMRRLLAAFPQLQGVRAEALLSGKAAQAIMARPANWAV